MNARDVEISVIEKVLTECFDFEAGHLVMAQMLGADISNCIINDCYALLDDEQIHFAANKMEVYREDINSDEEFYDEYMDGPVGFGYME